MSTPAASESHADKASGEPTPRPFFDENHRQAILAEQDFYTDAKTGYLVWTELYHLKRGYCCNNACRHCPYKR